MTQLRKISLKPKVQNLLACVVTGCFHSSSHNLQRLYWLPICINFKIANITFALSFPLHLLIYIQLCILMIPLILFGCQIPICSQCYMSALHLVPTVSALQLLQSRILTSRPIISNRPFNPLSAFLLYLRFSFG